MTVSTTQAFLELLEKSELLSPEQFAEARHAAGDGEDPKALARTLVQRELLTRWQAAQLLAGRSSFFVGRYKLLDLLGRGGMGSVFVAQHTTMNRRVALKVISKELGRDPASLERFLDEARAVAALDHPNIVHAYNVDNEGTRYYMVMEYVEGQDLQRMVESQGPLEFDKAVDYLRQAAEGLAHAHSRNMVHCDIKPANLIVNQQGVVKILDMGMARLTGRQQGSAPDERVLGSVDYLAPEQAVGSPEVDHRADIYALGCTFYFLLTGRPPFPEGTLAERILKHQTQEPQSILQLRPGTPRELVKICQKMMAKQPEKRFQSVAEVAHALGQWRPQKPKLLRAVPLEEDAAPSAKPIAPVPIPVKNGESATSGVSAPAGGVAKGGRNVDRRQIVVIAAIAGGVVLVVLMIVIGLLAGRKAREPRRLGPARPGVVKRTEQDPDAFVSKIPEPDLTFDPTKVPELKPEESPSPEPPPAAPQPKPEVKPEAKPQAQPEAKPEPKPEPKSEPKPQPKPETKPESKPEPKPEPKSEVKPEPKPAPPKPPPKPADPFSQFPKAVDLPVLGQDGGAEPFALGKVFTAPESGWQLTLYGGESALRNLRGSTRQFLLQEKETDPSKASWIVQLEEKPAGAEAKQTDVAKLWRDGDALKFQWVDGADPTSANFLRNCVLEVRADAKSAYVQLVTTKVVEPIVIDLYKGTGKASAPCEFLPDPAKLRVEVLKVEGRQGYTLEPAEPTEPKTPILLSFVRKDADGNEPDKVEFQIKCTAKGSGLSLEVTGAIVAALGKGKGQRAKLAAFFKRFSPESIEQDKTAIRAEAKALEDKLKNLKGEDRSNLRGQIREKQMLLWYLEFFETVHAKAKIHLRVYMEAGDQKTILLSTQP